MIADESLTERITPEKTSNGDDRNDYQHDRDIILYSSALQRLSGITQVVSAGTGHVFHNRLTHTLQVAQVGRRLAEKLKIKQKDLANALGGLDPDAIEAACLAHDLGHPPFGHVAEETLNRIAGSEVEGFEGNAQSFRIVAELAFRSPDHNGLNLTRATLKGILKYPWTYPHRPLGKEKKWGAYTSELPAYKHATGVADGRAVQRWVGAELMDWADDLTYSVHDVEDFYRAGLIPLHALRPDSKGLPSSSERQRFLNYVAGRREKIPELANVKDDELDSILRELIFAFVPIDRPYEGTREQRARLRKFTSNLVGRYINGLRLHEPEDSKTVSINEEFKTEIALLKQLTWCYVIDAPFLAIQQHAQRQIIRYLFNAFRHEVKRRPTNLLPPYYRDRLSQIPEGDIQERRVVVDLIAGMTEAQATAVYQRMNGIVVAAALDKILI